MPDPTPAPPPKPPAPPAVAAGPTINIGEEYGTAKKNLPPAKIVLIAIGAVLIVVLIASFVKRAKPQAAGSLDNVAAVEIPDQNSTMVALTFTLRNSSDKILYVHTVREHPQGARRRLYRRRCFRHRFPSVLSSIPHPEKWLAARPPTGDQNSTGRSGHSNRHRRPFP